MKSAHIVYIPFSGVGLHNGYRGDRWFKHRIEIFKNYTLKSLANQSNQDFILWCSFRPEEENNPLIVDIATAIKDVGISYVFTFNGLMYWDDKFTNYDTKTKVKNFLQVIWDSWHNKEFPNLVRTWQNSWENKNNTLLERVGRSIASLKGEIGTDHEWVYMTRIDSDDMFHRQAIELIQSSIPAYRKALTMDKGYMYNTETGQVAEWLPPTCPPFSTIIFPNEVFFSPVQYVDYYKDFKSHEDIPKVFETEQLDLYKYCVTAHGKDHISTSWDVPITKRIYHDIKYQRPYCYTTSGKNISTRWKSRTLKKRNRMLGVEFTDPDEKRAIMAQFGIDI